MSFVKILLSVPDSAATINSAYLQLKASPINQVDDQGLQKLMADVVDGAQVAYAKISTGAVQAAGVITFTGLPVAAETLSLANVTITAVAGAPAANEFQIGGTATITATNLAAAINASSNLSGIVTATSALGVVTVTAVQPGKSGNAIQLSESMTNTAVTAFSAGSDGTQAAVNYGRAS